MAKDEKKPEGDGKPESIKDQRDRAAKAQLQEIAPEKLPGDKDFYSATDAEEFIQEKAKAGEAWYVASIHAQRTPHGYPVRGKPKLYRVRKGEG